MDILFVAIYVDSFCVDDGRADGQHCRGDVKRNFIRHHLPVGVGFCVVHRNVVVDFTRHCDVHGVRHSLVQAFVNCAGDVLGSHHSLGVVNLFVSRGRDVHW